MDPHRFLAFRPYFEAYPKKEKGDPEYVEGASGKFSGSFPTWEMYITGDTLGADRHKYNAENFKYFSDEEKAVMIDAYQRAGRGQTLDAACELAGDPSEVFELLLGTDALIKEFRRRHMIGVGKQLSGAMAGKVPGTGREAHVGKFLNERMNYDLIQRPRVPFRIAA